MKSGRIAPLASLDRAQSLLQFCESLAFLIECDVFELKEVYVHFDLSLGDCCPFI